MKRHWSLVAALLFFAVLQAALAQAYLRETDGLIVYPLDDTYIQMAIGKNLAADGVWGVTRYEFSGAGSSLVWPLLLAGINRAAGLDDRTPFALNVIFAAAILWLAHAIMTRHIRSRTVLFAALVLIAAATPLPVLTLVGMEHTLETLAVLTLAFVGVRSCSGRAEALHRRGRALARPVPGQLWPAMAAAALTVAVRYDAASVLVVVLVLIALSRGWRAAVPIALSGAAPALAYAVIAWVHGWPAVPSPILLKHRFGSIDPWTWHGLLDIAGGGALTVLVNSPALYALVLVAVAVVATWRRSATDLSDFTTAQGDRSLEAPDLERESRLLLIVFTGAALVHVQFGRLGSLYRYEAYLIVLGLVAIASALAYQPPARWRGLSSSTRLAALLIAALVIHPLLLRGFLAARAVLAGASQTYRADYQLGQFFRRYPLEGGLMLGDLGTVPYLADVRLVDIGGLATLETLDAARAGALPPDLVSRLSHVYGVRVSIAGNPGGNHAPWPCVAGFAPRAIGLQPIWFFARDAVDAVKLERDLRAFEASEAGRVVEVTFAAELPAGGCGTNVSSH